MRISVTDTGRGIAPGVMARLFGAFDRLGAEATGIEGTGLGLALSKALTEAMGGRIAATSSPGQGSTFTVTLLSTTAVEAQDPAETASLPGRGAVAAGAHHVLYIEDNLANLTLVERLFAARPGIQLRPAMQGRLGLELASQERPDLVILDLHLPDMSGAEVLAALKADPAMADVPVIIASADATPG